MKRLRVTPTTDVRAVVENAGEPLLIEGLVSTWPASAHWSPEEFRRHFGEKIVNVNVSSSTFFDAAKEHTSLEQMKLGDYIELMAHPGGERRHYLQAQEIRESFPELERDIVLPGGIESRHLHSINLWFGPGGNVSPLHFDVSHNLFAQITGRKRFLLFPPGEFNRLYPHPWDSSSPHASEVNPDSPDRVRHPNFVRARGVEVTIEAGDLLFLPAFYWHHVYSLDTSISVNIWWRGAIRDALVPAGIRAFAVLDEPFRLLSNFFDLRGGESPLEVARHCLALGFSEPAFLLAVSALRAIPASVDVAPQVKLRIGELLERATSIRTYMLEARDFGGRRDVPDIESVLDEIAGYLKG